MEGRENEGKFVEEDGMTESGEEEGEETTERRSEVEGVTVPLSMPEEESEKSDLRGKGKVPGETKMTLSIGAEHL